MLIGYVEDAIGAGVKRALLVNKGNTHPINPVITMPPDYAC